MVEDSHDDTFLVMRVLQRGGFDVSHERVDTLGGMKDALAQHTWDMIISDYAMAGFGGAAALAVYQKSGLDIPFIIVSGMVGEDIAVEMMKSGAHDYVMKSNLSRLVPAVQRELRAAEVRRERKQNEIMMARLASIVESCNDAIVGKALDGTVLSWNPAAERLYGYKAEEMVGNSFSVLVPAFRPKDMPEISSIIQAGQRLEGFETVHLRKGGESVDVSLTISPIRDSEGKIVGASTVARDITQHKKEEQERLKLIEDLTEALAHVKTLRGLLPICAACKKIRNDQGYWEQVETYISERSDANFTHGLCPDCAQRLYPQLSQKPAASARVEG